MIDIIQSTPQTANRQVLIITGLSGAGKTSVMRTLEDLGFYCVDNLPVPLLLTFLKLAFQSNGNICKVALGIDARSEQFLSNLLPEIELIKKAIWITNLKIVFLNARQQTILKRFQETRRKHPLADGISLQQAITKEKSLLDPMMSRADIILDTDILNIHQLRSWVRKTFAQEGQQDIIVNLMSFGFKYGVPAESNLVYDLRFLPNPHFIPQLKSHDGREQIIQDYLFGHAVVQDYWQRLTNFLSYSLNKFHEEGLFFVTVAIGCTGGKHRSVAFTQKLAHESWPHVRFLLTHRDVEKE